MKLFFVVVVVYVVLFSSSSSQKSFFFRRANAEAEQLEGRTVTSSRAFSAPAFLNVRPRRDFDAGTHHVPINPLTANGTETWPIGYADVFSLKSESRRRGRRRRPDVFLSSARARFEKITLYEHVDSDDGKTFAPFFFRRNHVTHPFSGLKPPKAKCVSQNRDTKEIFGFFAVEGTILARSRYDEASGGFVGRKEIHVTGIRGNWKEIENVVCVPGRTDFVYLLVNDYRKVKEREFDRERAKILWKYEAPRHNPSDGAHKEEESSSSSSSSRSRSSSSSDGNSEIDNKWGEIETTIWKLEVGEAEDAKDSARAKKAKMPPPSSSSDDEVSRLPIVSAFGLEDGSILLGHSGGEITMYRKNIKSGEGDENEDDFVAHERVLSAPGDAPLNAHPTPNAVPMPYPYTSDDEDDNDWSDDNDKVDKMKTTFMSSEMPFDLLVGGVGGLYHYKRYVASTPYSRRKKSSGGLSSEATMNNKMIFYPPRICGEEDADTFVASLGTVSLVDLDNDGREDIVSGSAEGVLYALKNVGTNSQPLFMPASAIETKSGILRLVPNGNRSSLHGPRESRFGYTTATTFDFNEDGKFDILVNDFSGEMSILENIGKPSAMKFDALKKLYRETENGEKEVFKTDWRVKPFVGTNGKKIIVIAPCPDTSILLVFEKIGDALVKKVGALKMNDEKETRISTHTLRGGARGRLSIDIVDFDGDDVLDVLITAPKHASIPDPENGLPLHAGHYQAALLLLKGSSHVKGDTESDVNTVRFNFPEIVEYKGEPMYVGKSQGSVVATSVIGTSSKTASLPNLMVVCDAGRVYWYDRKDLSTRSIKSFARSTSSKKSSNGKNKSKPASRELERGWAVQFLSGTASPQCKAFDGGLVDFSALALDASSYNDGPSGNRNTATPSTASTFATVLLVLIFFVCVVIAGVGWSRFWMWARGQVAGRFNVSLGRTERREV